MLKIAYQLGVQKAYDEAGLSNEKTAGIGSLARRAWGGATKTPLRKALLGGGLGAGALGTGAALMAGEDEPSALQRAGSAAKDILGNKELMLGLTQSLSGAGGGGMGLTAGDAFRSFPPDPQSVPQIGQDQFQQIPGMYM